MHKFSDVLFVTEFCIVRIFFGLAIKQLAASYVANAQIQEILSKIWENPPLEYVNRNVQNAIVSVILL